MTLEMDVRYPTTNGTDSAFGTDADLIFGGLYATTAIRLQVVGARLPRHALAINIVGHDSVTKNPDQPLYDLNETVALLAIPDPGWAFSGWSGDFNGLNALANPADITIRGDMTVTATFLMVTGT